MGVPGADVLRALAERDLIFELMAHPDLLESAAATLADFDDLTVVVEHAGWPRSDEPEERALWKRGISALAALGDNVHCKLSGLAMPLALERGGGAPARGSSTASSRSASTAACSRATSRSTRCTAPSTSSTAAYDGVTADLDAETRDKLFAANAERLYRC